MEEPSKAEQKATLVEATKRLVAILALPPVVKSETLREMARNIRRREADRMIQEALEGED